jgi:hypothetical protein
MTRSRCRYVGAGTLVGSLIEIDELMLYRDRIVFLVTWYIPFCYDIHESPSDSRYWFRWRRHTAMTEI